MALAERCGCLAFNDQSSGMLGMSDSFSRASGKVTQVWCELEAQRAEQGRREELTRREQESWMPRDAEDRRVASTILHLPLLKPCGCIHLPGGNDLGGLVRWRPCL